MDINTVSAKVDLHHDRLHAVDIRIEKLTTLFESAVERQKESAVDIKATAATIKNLDDKLSILVNLDKEVKNIASFTSENREDIRTAKLDIGKIEQGMQMIPVHHDSINTIETKISTLDIKIESRMNAIDTKLESKINAIDAKLETKFAAGDIRFASLEKAILTPEEVSTFKIIAKKESERTGMARVIDFLWKAFGASAIGIAGWLLAEYIRAHPHPQDVNVQITGQGSAHN